MLMRSAEVTYEVVDGRAVLVDPQERELLTLNPVGTVVWQALDGSQDEADIVESLAEQFPDVPRSQIEGDVAAFIGELRTSELLEGAD